MHYKLEFWLDVEGYCWQYNIVSYDQNHQMQETAVIPIDKPNVFVDEALKLAMRRVPTFP